MAGQYVGEDGQLQRTLVQAMLLAGELSLAQEHMALFGLQVGGWLYWNEQQVWNSPMCVVMGAVHGCWPAQVHTRQAPAQLAPLFPITTAQGEFEVCPERLAEEQARRREQ